MGWITGLASLWRIIKLAKSLVPQWALDMFEKAFRALSDSVSIGIMVAMGASAGSTLLGMSSAKKGNEEANSSLLQQTANNAAIQRFQAEQADVSAVQERAKAQRIGFNARELATLAQSELQAKASGSGFTATDATTIQLATQIAERGAMQEFTAVAAGEDNARGLETQARSLRASADAGIFAAREQISFNNRQFKTKQFGSILSGIGQVASIGISGAAPAAPERYGKGATENAFLEPWEVQVTRSG